MLTSPCIRFSHLAIPAQNASFLLFVPRSSLYTSPLIALLAKIYAFMTFLYYNIVERRCP